VLPGIVAQPAFSTNDFWSQELIFFNSSCFAVVSPADLNWTTQMGARAATTADEARCSAFASALPPVTQPF